MANNKHSHPNKEQKALPASQRAKGVNTIRGKSHVLMHARSIGVRQNKEINIKAI